jgi:hypothetical protein
MRRAVFVAAAAALLFVAFSLFGDSVPARWLEPATTERVYPEPPLRGSADAAAPAVLTMTAVSREDIAAMRQWNIAGRVPMKVGVERRLEHPLVVGNRTATLSNEPFRWRATFRIEGSSRVRAKLTDVRAGRDTIFWAYGPTGEATGFDVSLAYDGTLWTPSVEGDTITIEVQSPGASAAAFTVTSLADIRRSEEVGASGSECIRDITCYSGLEDLQTTVAHMIYPKDGAFYICTGGLIGDIDHTGIPYFITANHCISTSASAAGLETFWDYKTASCNGPEPSLGTLRRVSGATLVSTTQTQDTTLLRLTSLPGGTRYFLGWTSQRPAVGETLYRISHPDGQPQRISTAIVDGTSSECIDTSRANFLYSKPDLGTVIGGSSGSPTLNESGQVVGTLNGGCPGSADPCGGQIRTTDGAFSAAYNTVFKPYLNPGSPIGNPCSACVANANTACMLNNRFKVTMTWRDPSASLSGNGRIISYSENRPITDPANGEVSQVSFWSMYPNDTTSVEALVRMIRGGSSFWIFTTGFAAAEYTVTVQDTKNCTTWQKTSPFGSTAKIADYNAVPF